MINALITPQMNQTTSSLLSKMFTFRFPDGREVYSKPTADKVAMDINNVSYENLFTDNICNNPCCSSTKRQIFNSKSARASHALICTIKKQSPQLYWMVYSYLKENVKVSKREVLVKRKPMKKHAKFSTINGGGVSRPPVAHTSPPSEYNENDSLDIDSPTYMDSLEEIASLCVEEYCDQLEELNGEFQNKERSIIRFQINKLDPLAYDYHELSIKIREPFLNNDLYSQTNHYFESFAFEADGSVAAQYSDSIDISSPTAIDEIREISAKLKNEYDERVEKMNKELEDKRGLIIRREIAKLDPMKCDYVKRVTEIRDNILEFDMY